MVRDLEVHVTDHVTRRVLFITAQTPHPGESGHVILPIRLPKR